MVGLDDLRGLFQPMILWFYDFMLPLIEVFDAHPPFFKVSGLTFHVISQTS